MHSVSAKSQLTKDAPLKPVVKAGYTPKSGFSLVKPKEKPRPAPELPEKVSRNGSAGSGAFELTAIKESREEHTLRSLDPP